MGNNYIPNKYSSTEYLGTKLSGIKIKIESFFFKKRNLKMSNILLRPWCVDVQICIEKSGRHAECVNSVLLWLLMMTSSNGNIFCVTALPFVRGPFIGELPTQRPETRSFDIFFDPLLNKRLSKQPWCWWFETPSRSLWRHCDVIKIQCDGRGAWISNYI